MTTKSKPIPSDTSMAAGIVKSLAMVLEDIECGAYKDGFAGEAENKAAIRLALTQSIVDKAGALESDLEAEAALDQQGWKATRRPASAA